MIGLIISRKCSCQIFVSFFATLLLSRENLVDIVLHARIRLFHEALFFYRQWPGISVVRTDPP